MWDTLAVILLAMVTFFLAEILGIYLKLNLLLTIVLSFGLAFLLFQSLKRKVVRSCFAKLTETSVEFDFADEIKVINFSDLISFKDYNGRNGPILYLKTERDNFKIFANNNFCKPDNFKIFCDDAIIQLDKYKEMNGSTLIHEGSIYATKGFLYFLIIATTIYLLSFIIESKELRPYIGIAGGFYLLIMWIAHFIKRDLKSK
jgi:hypothetical protein